MNRERAVPMTSSLSIQTPTLVSARHFKCCLYSLVALVAPVSVVTKADHRLIRRSASFSHSPLI